MTNIIVIKGFKKYFGKLHAVDGIDLEVKKGEILSYRQFRGGFWVVLYLLLTLN
jgi:ABC-type uncharacterized transport system ATPase subunit